jgi:hypothetical protein
MPPEIDTEGTRRAPAAPWATVGARRWKAVTMFARASALASGRRSLHFGPSGPATKFLPPMVNPSNSHEVLAVA